MTTVRETVHELLRGWGLTTVFGNPGSNELPFLDRFPADFRYVLGLHEGTVLAMADGYAQATGRPALVNLHAAAGLGNAMGNLANARQQHTPLIVTAGQQARNMVGLGAMLSEPELTTVPRPHVKAALEPLRAQDVPRALAEAYHLSTLPPAGPVFVSLPLDDWAAEVVPHEVEHLGRRRVTSLAAPAEGEIERLAARLDAAKAPVLVVGPEADREPVFDQVVKLAEAANLPVWLPPGPPRCGFPTTHPHYRGVLPNTVNGITETLAGHDFVLVLGAPVFRYHVNKPGPFLPAGTELVAVISDPAAAARSPMGDALVGDVGEVVSRLAGLVTGSGRPPVPPRPAAQAVPAASAPFPAEAVFDVLADVLPPDAVLVNESTSNTGAFWARIPIRRSGGLYFPAAGGLGFGLPAAVGVALADPGRRVFAVLGDGAAQYGIQGLWTAAHHRLPITFLVLRNDEYGALRRFTGRLGVSEVPGMDLPGIDVVSVARGYGLPARRVEDAGALRDALAATGGPLVVEVPITRT
ncbi:benzoylformate decarboxylase [Amycolatopsis alkalitolerans]|uniref:Benzoylformate decarboxylase n=1 Tax=Amycolatopsis alkalitolerans TaxID=2547244 RepID=A0A5C4LXB7_9PSEU|nr:benzoylformate decarboxylase [Amycolatopsis alkalitolerans]TNC23589.1 benzoylformate decarboxylase [Amycolatopsis alkalitolerans]